MIITATCCDILEHYVSFFYLSNLTAALRFVQVSDAGLQHVKNQLNFMYFPWTACGLCGYASFFFFSCTLYLVARCLCGTWYWYSWKSLRQNLGNSSRSRSRFHELSGECASKCKISRNLPIERPFGLFMSCDLFATDLTGQHSKDFFEVFMTLLTVRSFLFCFVSKSSTQMASNFALNLIFTMSLSCCLPFTTLFLLPKPRFFCRFLPSDFLSSFSHSFLPPKWVLCVHRIVSYDRVLSVTHLSESQWWC